MVIDKGVFRFLLRFFQFYRKNKHKKIILIKSAHPNNPSMYSWGDYHFACDLASGLECTDKFAAFIVPFEYWNIDFINNRAYLSLILSGVRKAFIHPANPHYLYVISHPEILNEDYVKQFNHVFCASLYLTDLLSKQTSDVSYLPQFTNEDRFYPCAEVDSELSNQVIFIGNTRNTYREAVKYCVAAKIPVAVYGKGWENYIPAEMIMGDYIDNNQLRSFYSNAAIVLNDHWPEMREQGFISNRIFDVSACNGFIITDYLSAIEQSFSDSIITYTSEDDLVKKINYYLNHPEERASLAAKAREITLRTHTNKAIATEILRVIEV